MHPSVNELLQDITAPTVERQPQALSTAPVTVTPAPDQTVQALPPVPVAADIKTDTPSHPAAVPQPQQTEQIKQPVSEEMLATGADVAIGMFDFAQQNIFKFFIKRKKEKKLEKINPNWITELDQLIQELENGSKEVKSLSGEQLNMLKIEKGVREILDHLPLSEDEKKQLRVPLIEIMRQNGGVIPANIQLMLSVLMIAGGRAADVFML
jgi:hypothetical protein